MIIILLYVFYWAAWQCVVSDEDRVGKWYLKLFDEWKVNSGVLVN